VILANYQKILEQIKAASPKTTVYVQTVLPTNNRFNNFPNHQNKTDKVQALNNGLKALAASHQVHLIDLYPEFLDAEQKLDKKYTNDGLHLLGAGYQHWKNILISNNAL
jgi:lysophospholipase L1-like esterase